MLELRDYQQAAKNKIMEWVEEWVEDKRDKTKPSSTPNTLVSITRSGKTFLTSAAIGEMLAMGLRVWVIVNRIELVQQWHSEFIKVNPNYPPSKLWFIASAVKKTTIYSRPLQFVQVQTLTSKFKDIKDQHKPDIVIYDEAHETAFQKVADKLSQRWNVKQINLTATPVRHGKSQQQYIDKFPLWENPSSTNKLKSRLKSKDDRQFWFQAATADQMINKKLWKTPKWIVASDELSKLTEQRFSGVTNNGYEYDDTSQSKVMIDLLPQHIKEWQENGGESHSTIWYCCDVNHVDETLKALQAIGRKAASVTGETDPNVRRKVIESFRSGKITDLVNCQCLTTGFDAPRGSCGVFLRRTMSVGLFCQMAGRPLTYFDGIPEGLLMDFAGNLALHPFPEKIDWWAFNPCKKVFRDPNLVVCKCCKHRHDGIPKPIHPHCKKVTFNTSLGEFVYPENWNDGMFQLPHETSLKCESCGEPVYYDKYYFPQYAEWLKSVRSAAMEGERPEKYDHHTAGVSIGEELENSDKLTIELMYQLGLWSLSDGENEGTGTKDKSEEWRKLREKQLARLDGKKLVEQKLSLLNPEQQEYIRNHPMSEITNIEDMHQKYRAALTYAYVGGKSPLSAFECWDGLGSPPKDDARLTFYRIWQNDEECYLLMKQWLEGHYEKEKNGKRRGAILTYLKLLSEVVNGWTPESKQPLLMSA